MKRKAAITDKERVDFLEAHMKKVGGTLTRHNGTAVRGAWRWRLGWWHMHDTRGSQWLSFKGRTLREVADSAIRVERKKGKR